MKHQNIDYKLITNFLNLKKNISTDKKALATCMKCVCFLFFEGGGGGSTLSEFLIFCIKNLIKASHTNDATCCNTRRQIEEVIW